MGFRIIIHSRGIEQVNQAVTEMGNVVQQVAASAEEFASTSEEMSAQSAQVKTVVQELVVLIKGSSKHTEPGKTSPLQIHCTGVALNHFQRPSIIPSVRCRSLTILPGVNH